MHRVPTNCCHWEFVSSSSLYQLLRQKTVNTVLSSIKNVHNIGKVLRYNLDLRVSVTLIGMINSTKVVNTHSRDMIIHIADVIKHENNNDKCL